jgi:hypothetical protein
MEMRRAPTQKHWAQYRICGKAKNIEISELDYATGISEQICP